MTANGSSTRRPLLAVQFRFGDHLKRPPALQKSRGSTVPMELGSWALAQRRPPVLRFSSASFLGTSPTLGYRAMPDRLPLNASHHPRRRFDRAATERHVDLSLDG